MQLEPPKTFWRSPAGLPYWVDGDGNRTLAIVSGGDDDDNGKPKGKNNEGGTGDNESSNDDKDQTETLTKHQLSSLLGRTTKAAKQEAEKELSEALGMPIDEAKTLLGQLQADADAKKSDLERERDEERAKREEAETKAATKARELLLDRATLLLEKAGLSEKTAARLAGTLELDADATKDDVKAAVDALVEDDPELFTANGGKPPTPPGSTGHNRSKNTNATDATKRDEEAKRIADAMNKRRGYTAPSS